MPRLSQAAAADYMSSRWDSGSSTLSGVLRIMSLLFLVLFQKSSLLMWYFLRLLEPGGNYESIVHMLISGHELCKLNPF